MTSRPDLPESARETLEETVLGRRLYRWEEDLGSYGDATVLVTGAGGTLAGQILKRLAQQPRITLLLLDKADVALQEVTRELSHLGCTADIEPLLGDMSDHGFMEDVFRRFKPTAVIHTAAYKVVPLIELNPIAAARNNVIATAELFNLAAEYQARDVVFMSSDEANGPENVFGHSKRWAELMLGAAAQSSSRTTFKAVRFGVVLFSHGTVGTLFYAQASRGEALTVTHEGAERYFCGASEAVGATLLAPHLGATGDVLVVAGGDPVRIIDVATRLKGALDSSSEIRVVGLRPGETRVAVRRNAYGRESPMQGITILRQQDLSWGEIERHYEELREAVSANDSGSVRALLASSSSFGEAR